MQALANVSSTGRNHQPNTQKFSVQVNHLTDGELNTQFEQLFSLRESIDSKSCRNGKRGEKKSAQEIGFLCLYYCEKLKEELGVPVMELE